MVRGGRTVWIVPWWTNTRVFIRTSSSEMTTKTARLHDIGWFLPTLDSSPCIEGHVYHEGGFWPRDWSTPPFDGFHPTLGVPLDRRWTVRVGVGLPKGGGFGPETRVERTVRTGIEDLHDRPQPVTGSWKRKGPTACGRWPRTPSGRRNDSGIRRPRQWIGC